MPVNNEGTKTDVGNYTPISLLLSLYKIYDKWCCMRNRIIKFLETNRSLHLQYGFRHGQSREHALLKAQHLYYFILFNTYFTSVFSTALLLKCNSSITWILHLNTYPASKVRLKGSGIAIVRKCMMGLLNPTLTNIIQYTQWQ